MNNIEQKLENLQKEYRERKHEIYMSDTPTGEILIDNPGPWARTQFSDGRVYLKFMERIQKGPKTSVVKNLNTGELETISRGKIIKTPLKINRMVEINKKLYKLYNILRINRRWYFYIKDRDDNYHLEKVLDYQHYAWKNRINWITER